MNVTITLDKSREMTYNFSVDGEKVGWIAHGFNGYGVWNAYLEPYEGYIGEYIGRYAKHIKCDTISGAYIRVMVHAGQDTAHDDFWPTFDEFFSDYEEYDEDDGS